MGRAVLTTPGARELIGEKREALVIVRNAFVIG
jgi:hypothetical protein